VSFSHFSPSRIFTLLVLDHLIISSFLEFRTNKPSDVISTLVSIYDSKDLFVKELQVLLAQRLLMVSKEGTDRVEREVRTSNFSHYFDFSF